jgi:hypothetical protein
VLEALVVQFNGNKSIKFFTDSLNAWLQTGFSEVRLRARWYCTAASRRLSSAVVRRQPCATRSGA